MSSTVLAYLQAVRHATLAHVRIERRGYTTAAGWSQDRRASESDYFDALTLVRRGW